MSATKLYTVAELASALGVTRQAYYKWLNRTPSDRDLFIKELSKEVVRLAKVHNYTLGTRGMTRHVNKEENLSKPVGRKLVTRVMNANNVRTTVRAKKHNRREEQETYIQENVLNREFTAEMPNQKWTSDFTLLRYGPYGQYSARLSVVLDLYGGFALAHNISETETSSAAIQTFQRAFISEGNVHPLIHTDRGSAYTSKSFNNYMVDHEVLRSMSRPGTPYDNSVMERWWNDFKLRWMDKHPMPTTLKELHKLVAAGIDYFNYVYRPEKNNDLTPYEYRNEAIVSGFTA